MVKLAGVLFMESGKVEDITKCKKLLERVIELDPAHIDAYLLKGKILYREEEWNQSALALEKSI